MWHFPWTQNLIIASHAQNILIIIVIIQFLFGIYMLHYHSLPIPHHNPRKWVSPCSIWETWVIKRLRNFHQVYTTNEWQEAALKLRQFDLLHCGKPLPHDAFHKYSMSYKLKINLIAWSWHQYTYDFVLLLQCKQLDYQLPELVFICLNAWFALERLIYCLVGCSNKLAPTLNQWLGNWYINVPVALVLSSCLCDLCI